MGGSWEARNGQQSGKGCLVAMSKNVSDSIPHFAAHLISKIPPTEFQNLQVTFSTGPTNILTISWNRITVASNNGIILCAGLEASSQQHASVAPSMSFVSSFAFLPQLDNRFPSHGNVTSSTSGWDVFNALILRV